jgi:hypothetical protein
MNFLIELVQRVQKDSPLFFIRLRWATAVLAVIAFAIKQLLIDKVWEPAAAAKVAIVAQYFITSALTVWGTSFLPVSQEGTAPSSQASQSSNQ